MDRFGLEPARAGALAAELGSDVPVCLLGGTAWMRGRGEVLEPVAAPAPTPVVVAVPPIHSSTPAVYRAWDDLGGPSSTRAVAAPPALAAVTASLVNDLEPAAERVEPALADVPRARSARPPAASRSSAGAAPPTAPGSTIPTTARAAATRVERELGVVTFAGSAGAGPTGDASCERREPQRREPQRRKPLSDPVDGAASASS